MRGLQQICAQLPIADSASFEQHAFGDYADVQAVNLLGTVLKASEMFNGLVEDFKLSNGNTISLQMSMMEGGVMMEEDDPHAQALTHGKQSKKKSGMF